MHSQYQEFTRNLEAEDWANWDKYARRVRALHIGEYRKSPILSKELLDEIARTRVSLHILPNLRSLTWIAYRIDHMRASLIFMHHGITRFTTHLVASSEYAIGTYFKEIQTRMPYLEHIDFRFSFPVREIEDDVVRLIQGLPKLKRIVFPVYTLTSRIVEALSRLPKLETVQFEFPSPNPQGQGDPKDIMDFSPQLDPGAFPALLDLSLSGHLSHYTTFLTGPFYPENLTVLYSHVCWDSSPEDVDKFVTTVAENCHSLTELHIDYFGSPPVPSSGNIAALEPRTSRRLSWQELRPILSCTHLTVFELRWDKPLAVSEDDLEEMASHWPALKTLQLDCEPMDISIEPSITLRALLPFAKHCQELEQLGLYMAPFTDTSKTALGLGATPFRSLKQLCVGLSPIQDPGPVALYLSQLCPSGCRLEAGMTWPDEFVPVESEDLQRRSAEWHETWQEVNRMLPLLIRLREEERANRTTLDEEVEDLRIRNRLLLDTPPAGFHPDNRCIIC
ncbi:hypothetical protein EIP86_008464 [Pleurotus ostreatoroseus]|nr:hypothetical protein EIP86_008464 [Pleurotus ostreatoroseus]